MLTSIDLANKHTYGVCQDLCLEYHFGRVIRMGEEQEKGMVLVVEDEESSVCLTLPLFVCLTLCFAVQSSLWLSVSHLSPPHRPSFPLSLGVLRSDVIPVLTGHRPVRHWCGRSDFPPDRSAFEFSINIK